MKGGELEVNLTYRKFNLLYRGIIRLSQMENVSWPVSLMVSNLMKETTPLFRSFEDARVGLLKKYGFRPNPNSDNFQFEKQGQRELFDEELDKIQEEEVVFSIPSLVKVSKLQAEGLRLTGQDLFDLAPILSFDLKEWIE